MTHPSLESIIGRELKDSYGRYVGIITGISTDSNGKIQSVGVDAGSNGFTKFEGDRITFEEDSPLLTSEWKLNTDSFLRTSGIAEKKMLALQELYEEGEIAQDVYEHLTNRHKSKLDEYSGRCEDTVESLNKKVESLSLEGNAVNTFVGTLKLQHRIGDISDDVFRAAAEYMGTILQRNEKEIADISTVLHDIAPQELTEEIETEDISKDEAVESTPEVEMMAPETSEEPEYQPQNEPISADVNTVSELEAPIIDAPIMSPETESNESERNWNVETCTPPICENVTPIVEDPQEELSENTNTSQEEPIQEPEVEQESPSFDTSEEVTEVSDNITTEEPEVEQESPSFDTSEEVTEVSEGMQVTETESVDNQETVSDQEDADGMEINNSVSFDEDLTEQTEETPTDENTETPESSTEPEEERVVYSSQ
jgi:hypothetical protein